ncbi:DUF5983 family protein [Yersinia pseudotuberculosis]|uniref:DUF5983 family protein n=1 Tax=Yersinia pseudotuberculosis TaxID=633 RepID=UPI0005E9B90E|nr:DUF5983 family protein [Yersinia pseudotuberculosis]MBO1551437.1 hypothetical protein [Yersinia pseudotuberculosis]MBO1571647.1 hypothetical protein [Yersinia pseudotuberculosis]MBO1586594.1 hypothetical protein [Yersinia pseudotuberculosis]MBO1631944.1 hypothetical protein [Yersinia pseudotuberculosis]MBO1636186.1 hypothetical protein [Yersinia pseudotuberculosis]
MLTTIQQTHILTLRGLQCSTAHITEDDNTLLYRISHCQAAFSDGEWLLYTGTGYLLRLDAWIHPVLRLKRLGLSKTSRRLATTLMKRHGLTYLHIDALGDVLPGFATFDW